MCWVQKSVEIWYPFLFSKKEGRVGNIGVRRRKEGNKGEKQERINERRGRKTSKQERIYKWKKK